MRRATWVLIALFVITRVPVAWLALRPDVYLHDGINTSSDVTLYEGWAAAMFDGSKGAYSGVRIEYPPGSLPFILGPRVVGDTNYLKTFVWMMVAIDIAGFAGLALIARRWGSRAGPLLWIFAVAALGPIAYLRLDLVPAVATIWAFERASDDDWVGSGGWMGVGAIAKLYPLLFLPAGVILAAYRRRFAIAAAVVFIAPLLPLLPVLGDVVDSVLGYHSDRGIQVESLWGGILFLAQRSGAEAGIGYSFGALHFDGPLSETFRTVAPYVSIAGLAIGIAAALRSRRRREAPKAFVESCFVILALALTTGTVFSPQFLLWLLAVGGAVCCMTDSRLRLLAAALIPVAVITQTIFPFLYNKLLLAETLPLVLLWIRNVTVAAMGIGGAIVLWRTSREPISDLSTPEPASA